MSECEYAGRLSAYHDGELGAAPRALLEEHLRGCAECAAELARIRTLSGLLGGLPLPEVSAAAMRRFHASAELAYSGGIRRWASVLTAIAATILVTFSVWLWRMPQASAPAEALSTWELSVIQRPTELTASSPEDQFAVWAAQDLSPENGHD